jgi:hypothetical protein
MRQGTEDGRQGTEDGRQGTDDERPGTEDGRQGTQDLSQGTGKGTKERATKEKDSSRPSVAEMISAYAQLTSNQFSRMLSQLSGWLLSLNDVASYLNKE